MSQTFLQTFSICAEYQYDMHTKITV